MPDAGIGAAIGGIGSLVGGALGAANSGGTTTQTNSGPWQPQQDYDVLGLQNAWSNYQNAQNQIAQGVPQTYVAPENSQQTNAANSIYSQGMNAANTYNPMISQGQSLTNYANQYGQNAANIAQNGIQGANQNTMNLLTNYAMTGQLPNSTGGMNQSLMNSAQNAASTGVNGLQQGQQISNMVAGQGLNAQNGINAMAMGGNSALSNPTLQAQINATDALNQENLTQNVLPGLDMAAQTSGNANSSRAGAQDAIATEATQNADAAAAANILGSAYNTGQQLGASTYLGGLSAANTGASNDVYGGSAAGNLATNSLGLQNNASQFQTTAQLGAANSQLGNQLNYSLGNANTQLAGNAQLGTGINTGANMINTGYGGIINGLNSAYAGGAYNQAGTQAGITNSNDAWQESMTAPQQALANYWQIASTPLGTNGSTTASPTNGILGGALSGAVTGGVGATSAYNANNGNNGFANFVNGLFGNSNTGGLSSSAYAALPNYAALENTPSQITASMWGI